MEAIQKVLNGLVLFNLDINLWSGKKKLKPEDLKGATLPPETLATLGSKRIYDPNSLTIFAKLKKQAERGALAVGTRFLGGYAVPEEKAAGLWKEISTISTEFDTAKSEFLSDYDTQLNSWLDQAGEWRDIVAAAIEPASNVSSKLQFGFTAYKVDMPKQSFLAAEDHRTDAEEVMESQVNGLADQLIREIGKLAKDAWEESYKGRTEVTRKALRPLKAISDKLTGLAFVAPEKIWGLVTNVNAALDAVPKTGPVTGSCLMGIVGVLAELSDLAGFMSATEKDAMFASISESDLEEEELLAEAEEQPPAEGPVDEEVFDEEEEVNFPEIQVIPEPVQEVEAWFW